MGDVVKIGGLLRLGRWRARALGCAILYTVLCTGGIALGASEFVTGVKVEGLAGGYTRVDITFAGNAPPNFQLSGDGGQTVLVQIPDSSASGVVLNHPYLGANGVSSVTVTDIGAVTVRIDLTQPLHVVAVASGHDLVLDVDTSPALSSARTQSTSTGPAIEGARTYVVVRLQYADVGEVANLLVSGQQVQPTAPFQPQGSIFSLPTSAGSQSVNSGGISSLTGPQEPLGARLSDSVAYDRRLNAIILSGTPAEIAAMRNLIAQVDVPAQSVMLECKVVEMSEATATDLGLGLNAGAGTPVAVGTVAAGGTPGSKPQYNLSAQANLYATIERDGGKVLASPSVLATDNVAAQILTGDALPIITTTIYPGGTAVTQSSVNYIAVGVNLQIQPHVASDGYVTSDIFAEVSSVTAYVTTSQGSVPEISLRQITTLARVRDGQPFVVGGLFLNEEITSMTRIPVLSELPLLGGLFRARHDSSSLSNLYVVVTPHILHSSADQGSQ